MANYKTFKESTLLSKLFFLFFIASCSFASCFLKKANNISTTQKQQKNNMKKILIIGMNPKTIDFTNPELPKGLTIDIIEKGTKATLERLFSIGYDAQLFLIDTGETDLNNLAKQLKENNYDGVVVGNGIRGIKSNFILFEQIINVVHSNSSNSKIIFNSLPTDTEEAIKRWL
jgi:hypothetical protein